VIYSNASAMIDLCNCNTEP